jgi:hypothetical protein
MAATTTITKSDIKQGLAVARKAKAATVKPAPVKATKSVSKPKATTSVTVKDGRVVSVSAAQVARDNGLDGRRFRAYLRAMDMPRKFATKAEVTKAVKAFQAAVTK